MMPSRLVVPFLCVGIAATAVGFASVGFGPYFWSEKTVALGMFLVSAAFVANVVSGIKEKKIRQSWGGRFTTVQEGRVIFGLNLLLSSVLAAFPFAFAFMLWFYVRAIR